MPITTSFSAIDAVADAVIAALNVSGFTAVCPTVGTALPQAAALPCARVSDFTETPNDTAGKHGRTLTFAIHIYAPGTTTQGALKQGATILNQAIALLDYVPLAVSGVTSVSCQYETAAQQTEDVDGIEVSHIIASFRVRAMES
jgi:hypothetical protein